MAGYTAGSVTATIELNTTQFKEALETLKKDVAALKGEFESIGGVNKFTKEIETLKKEVNSLTKTNENYRKTIDNLKKTNKEVANSNKDVEKSSKNKVKAINEEISVINRETESVQRLSKEEAALRKKRMGSNYPPTVNIPTNEIGYSKNGIKRVKSLGEELKRTEDYSKRVGQAIDKDRSSFERAGTALGETNKKLAEQTTNVRQAGRGLTSFNNGVVQTAHSGRILSNTLYQIRGALLSLKMIFTAMGGMMLWGFATDVAESVKETVTAKNEMEAQLKQNSKVDASGIQYFRKELDKLPKTFQKVNKYAVGETVSSIGLEFNLTAKQMKDALPIVTMIQSEYVRAGRKTSEAALAVKDILQGEFQRLSRETGVGKEELVAYGWDEDKTNIDGLLKALNKAALDRHWDIFAKKATSLNDVVTITKSRFSELGAEVADSVTPLIVGGFNTLIDTITGLQNAFQGLSSFWQNFTLFGGGTAVLGGLLTALPMVVKGMGAVDIATIGWGKSILATALNLNKAEVAQYGFRKALAAVISGTTAAELSETRWTKAIAGRLLGVKQSTLAQRGYLTSLVQSNLMLKGESEAFALLSANSLGTAQKIGYLTTNMKLQEVQGMKTSTIIRKMATSWKLWRIAILGVTGIGVISWLSSVAMWTDTVKKRVEAYNDILQTGKDKIKSAKDDVENYTNQLSKLTEGTEEYERVSKNLETAKHNVWDTENAYKYAKEIKKTNKELTKSHDLMLNNKDNGLNAIYSANGVKQVEKYGKEYQKIKFVAYDLKKAEDERYRFQYASLQHINEHVTLMKQAGISEKDRIKYITEYNTKAEEAANHLKEFNQGDLMAGVYYLLDRIALMWIDLWNDKDFINFWNTVKRTFDDLKPTLYAIKDAVVELGRNLMKYFSTENGRWVGTIIGVGAAFGIIAYKLRGVGGKVKDAYGGLKKLSKWWKKSGDEAEEATKKMGGDTSTGGVVGGGIEKGKFRETLGNQLRGDAAKYARAAVGIAAGMALITEAIYLLKAPMWGLSEVGKQFKAQEPEIRAGIDGLKLIAPVMLVLLPPVIALSLIMDKYAPSFTSIVKGAGKAAVGIAAGMVLVTEAIYLMKMPMWSLGEVGKDFKVGKENIQGGINAMKSLGEGLSAMMPFVPIFAAGIALAAVTFAAPEVGLILDGAAVVGIAGGMVLLSEAIITLRMPLEAIRELGNSFTDIDGVKKGTEAIKATAEALGYVESAFGDLAKIKWDLLAGYIADLIGIKFGVDLTQLSGEGGFFDQLKTFTEEFNKVELTPIDTDKVTTLSESATGIDSVKTALNTVKDALKDLPNFNVDNRSTNEKYQDAVGGKGTTEGITNYFEQLKQPIEQLNEFIGNFNELEIVPVEEGQVTTLQNSANAITTIQTAIEAVKNAVGAGVDAQWNSNVQTSGILGAGLNLLVGNAGQSSSIKGSLDELYNCVKDIMDFNTRISGLTSEGSGDTSGIQNTSNMVSALQTQINSLKTTLSGAIPTIQSTAKGMGTAIITGFQSGLVGLDSAAKTAGGNLGTNAANGFKDNFKIQDIATGEVDATLTAISGKDQEFYDKGKAMGEAFQRGYKDGGGINSPGYAAQAMQQEIGYMEQYIQGGMNSLPQMAYNLGNLVSGSFNFDFGLSNIQLPNLTQFTDSLGNIPSMVTGVKDSVSTDFTTIQTNVGNSFNSIVGKTRTSLANMQGQTTKNIGAIRTSWRGMQSALIASAENIRSQTGQKISSLRNNMADFWKKIQNPSTLIQGYAGGHRGTRPVRYGGSPRVKGLYAGGTSSTPNISKDIKEYLACLMTTGKDCYAGGWSFNWNKPIQGSFKKWNTHFGKYRIDDYIKVGSFNNNNFPVKGIAEIAKAYIFDTIAATSYDKYFNSKFGENPVSALMAGAFNCWDGTNIVLAIARAFGFEGSRGHGTWNGIGHVWADIPGLGIIDPTAIQNNRSFTSSAVKGYHAGGTVTRNSSGGGDLPVGNTYNTKIQIDVHGNDVEVNHKRIDQRSGKQLLDILGINPATGR